MASAPLPSIRWQRQSPLDNGSAHSLLIALLRGLAALQVAAAHLRAEMFPGLRELADPPLYYQMLAFATGFAHQAVVVFFLISGWLVGGSLLNKLAATAGHAAAEPAPWRGYAIDRLTRLWIVLVPALCLMLLIGAITDNIDPAVADFSLANDYSAASFAGNLVGLQTIVVKNFSGNYALWSLANETWYYVQFPLLLVVFTGATRLRQAGAAVLLVLLGATLPLPITLYFALWLLGALFSRIRIACSTATRVGLVVVAVACSTWFRIHGSNDDLEPDSFLQDLVYSLPLLAFLSAMQFRIDPDAPRLRLLSRTAHILSEFSFTLYVIHIPLIKLLRYLGLHTLGRDRLAADAPLDYAIYAALLATLLAAAYVAYLLFESHTFRLRRALKAALQPAPRRPAIGSAAMKRDARPWS
jgi:peptidoglycan/LPS O-acetylase OafA/YrhL